MICCAAHSILGRGTVLEIIRMIRTYGIPTLLPIDFNYDLIIKNIKAKSFWQEPASVLQGSSNGFYDSSLGKIESKVFLSGDEYPFST